MPDFSFRSLVPSEQILVSRLAIWPIPVTWDFLTTHFASDFGGDVGLAIAFRDLEERGFLTRDLDTNEIRLDPTIRRYCYDIMTSPLKSSAYATETMLRTSKSKSQFPLRVFLCHASDDKPLVRKLYSELNDEPWIDPWLDEEKLLPGSEWQDEIAKAVKTSDVVLICLSKKSISKEGFVQKEIRYALDVADEKPSGTVFLIPLKLEECTVPERIAKLQWVKYFDEDYERKLGYKRLILALQKRAKDLAISYG